MLRTPRTIAAAAMLAVMVGVNLATIVAAGSRGMCGDGDLRPSCATFAVALNVYGMMAVLAVTTLATLVTYALRRRPPVLLKAASMLSVAVVGVFILPVWAAGNKLGAAIVVMMLAPIVLILLGVAGFCLLLWLGEITGDWISRRVATARPSVPAT